jgi:hypothetical protein
VPVPERRDEGCRGSTVWRDYQARTFRFRVAANSENLSDLVDRFLQPFRISPAGSGAEVPTFEIFSDGRSPATGSLWFDNELKVTASSLAPPVDRLLWEVSQAAISDGDGLLTIHAGAVSSNGTGLLIPGPSGAGKSTLVAGLTVAGFNYLGDELGLVNPADGTLRPFPRALWMSRTSIAMIDGLVSRLPIELDDVAESERHVSPNDLRPGSVGDAAQVRHIVVPEYAPEGPTSIEHLSPARVVALLGASCFQFERLGAEGLSVLAEIVKRCETLCRLRSRILDEAVVALSDLLGMP